MATIEETQITLIDAAEQLGVHYMTAYRYVRTGRLEATKKGGQWWVSPTDLASLTQRKAAPSVPRRSGGVDFEANTARLQRRLTAADESGAWTIINETLTSGATPVDVHNRLITPAMHNIGAAWAAGELSIAEEHQASATLTRLLGRMTSMFRHPGRRKGMIVIGSVAGEQHTLATAMLADLLADAGFEVIDMGSNTPIDSFIEVVKRVGNPVLVGLCCTAQESLDSLEATANALREELPEIGLFVGGNAAASIADRLPIDGHAASGSEAVELFDRYLAG